MGAGGNISREGVRPLSGQQRPATEETCTRNRDSPRSDSRDDVSHGAGRGLSVIEQHRTIAVHAVGIHDFRIRLNLLCLTLMPDLEKRICPNVRIL